MADIHRSDKYLTADNLDLVRTVNFSGRYYKNPIDAAHLEAELSKIFAFDRELLRSRVVGEYALKSRVEWLLQSYETLLARSPRESAGGRLRDRRRVPRGKDLSMPTWLPRFSICANGSPSPNVRRPFRPARRPPGPLEAPASTTTACRTLASEYDPYPHVLARRECAGSIGPARRRFPVAGTIRSLNSHGRRSDLRRSRVREPHFAIAGLRGVAPTDLRLLNS